MEKSRHQRGTSAEGLPRRWGVQVWDTTTNNPSHESVVISCYENLQHLEFSPDMCNYELTLPEAMELLKQMNRQIDDEGIEWASANLDYIDL